MLENQETNQDIISVATENLNIVIESKKLQMNYIWCTKISQEDLNTPKILEDPNQHLQLLSNMFESILRLATKVNVDFENLINSNEMKENNFNELCYNMMYLSSALVRKFKNFVELKNKQFKKDKNLIEPLLKLQKNFSLFKLNLKGKTLSKTLEDFYQNICDFNNLLEIDNHIK
jgi:hypothetical protein